MKAKVKRIAIPQGKRAICVSDVHGNRDIFIKLLEKARYSGDDILVLLGDLYTKGPHGHETLKHIIELSKSPNVFALRGNCDWVEEYLSSDEKAWLEGLPHIIESEDYIFVHGGITHGKLDEQDARSCMKNDAFMEKGLAFDKYVITGHWPTNNYTHEIYCCNPYINEKTRVISIDGGKAQSDAGQLNAFIIKDGVFSFEAADDLPVLAVEKAQEASGGSLNITWNDRFVELVEEGGEFSLYRHTVTGKTLSLPARCVWKDGEGRLCGCHNGTDFYLPVSLGDAVSVVGRYSDRILAKKDGVVGWVLL